LFVAIIIKALDEHGVKLGDRLRMLKLMRMAEFRATHPYEYKELNAFPHVDTGLKKKAPSSRSLEVKAEPQSGGSAAESGNSGHASLFQSRAQTKHKEASRDSYHYKQHHTVPHAPIPLERQASGTRVEALARIKAQKTEKERLARAAKSSRKMTPTPAAAAAAPAAAAVHPSDSTESSSKKANPSDIVESSFKKANDPKQVKPQKSTRTLPTNTKAPRANTKTPRADNASGKATAPTSVTFAADTSAGADTTITTTTSAVSKHLRKEMSAPAVLMGGMISKKSISFAE